MTSRASIVLGAVAVAALGLVSTSSTMRGEDGLSTPIDGAVTDHLVPDDDLYRSPINLAVSQDGKRLFVVCENLDAVLVVDTESYEVVGEVPVGNRPFGIALSPDGETLYVSNRRDDTVSVLSTTSLEVTATIPTGGDPHGLTTDASGAVLYVANLYHHDISLISTDTHQEIKRLKAGMQPFDIALGANGRYVYVSNQLTNPVPFREPPRSEVTIIDTERQLVADRRILSGAAISQGIAASPDGELVFVALELPKNLIPETQIYQGWMLTYALAVLESRPGGRVAFLLLDEMNLYFADPYGIAFSPDGRFAYVSSSGVDTLSVVDLAEARELLKIQDGQIGLLDEEIELYARHLALSFEYVAGRISTGTNPKGVVASPDGHRIFVANRMSDSITVIDAESREPVGSIDLGGPDEVTLVRRGETLFNKAVISFQNQLACNTCHPESNVDGLLYDIAVDGGLGGNLVDNRTMRGVAHTGPFKWSGKNPTLARQEGPRAAQLFFRSHGFTEIEDRDAVVAFIESTPLAPNRHRGPDDSLTPAQQRGKALFERAETRDGRYIPIANRCVTCHPAPYYTDQAMHDIGSRAYFDTEGQVDTPQLTGLYESPPYMHDGRCWSLEEIWTLYNPYDLHGVANDMTKQQLNDLIEYLKTL